jgi:hypothetical protein
MASQVQIVKLALQHIGDRYDISDIEEESVEAEQANLIYDDTRKELLRRYPWRFAKKYTSPATLSGITVPGQWDYAYAYPSSCVRVGGITNTADRTKPILDFEVSLLDDDTKVLLTDEQSAEFFYTSDITDPTRFDPEFTMAFSFLLAERMCMSADRQPGHQERPRTRGAARSGARVRQRQRRRYDTGGSRGVVD